MGKKTGPNPTDRAKTGTKRSLLTDERGVPLGIAIAGANVNDFKLVEETLASIPVERPQSATPEASEPTAENEQSLCLDHGYFYDEVYELVANWGYTAHIRPVGSGKTETLTAQQKREAGVKARRWVVERTHSWLNRFRGLLIRWCKKGENYLAMLHLACGLIAFRTSALPG